MGDRATGDRGRTQQAIYGAVERAADPVRSGSLGTLLDGGRFH